MWRARGTGPTRQTKYHDKGCSCHFCRNQVAVGNTLGKRLFADLPRGLSPQFKYVDDAGLGVYFYLYTDPPPGFFTFMPVEGPALWNRVGRKISLKALHITGGVINHADATEDLLRWIIVYDKQPNGAVPLWSDVVQQTSYDGTVTNQPQGGLNMSNQERFDVLLDYQWKSPFVTRGPPCIIGQTDTTDNAEKAPWSFDMIIPLNDRIVGFQSSGGTISDVSTGSIIIFCGLIENDETWFLRCATRLLYTDA